MQARPCPIQQGPPFLRVAPAVALVTPLLFPICENEPAVGEGVLPFGRYQ